MQNANRLEDLAALWNRLPKWLRYGLFYLGLLAVFWLFDSILDQANGLWPTLGFGTVLFISGLFLAVRVANPEHMAADELTPDPPRSGKRKVLIRAALGVGFMACIGLVWVALRLVHPDDGARQFEGTLFAAGILLYAAFGLPLLAIVMGLIVAQFVRPAWLRSDYELIVSADPEAARLARADIPRLADHIGYVSHAERLGTAGGQANYRLIVSSPFARFMGLQQEVSVRMDEQGALTIETSTRSGDYEKQTFRFAPAADGTAEVSCTGWTWLRSPLLRFFKLVAGHRHLAKGGANIEAQRFARLLGADCSVAHVESSLHADKLSQD